MWALGKKKGHKTLHCCSSFVGHVPPSPPVLGGQGWELPWASYDGGAGARGPADPAWEAWTPKRWGGPHSCRKLCCCLPSVQSGCCPTSGTQWMNSVQQPGRCWGTSHWWFSRASASVQFLAVLWQLQVLWQDLLTVMLLTLMYARNSDFVYNPHPCSCSTQALLFKGSLSQRSGTF